LVEPGNLNASWQEIFVDARVSRGVGYPLSFATTPARSPSFALCAELRIVS
jgi:hypothetical protein